MIAYALFKRAVREEAQAGRKSPGYHRDPPPTVVDTYRAASERLLQQVIQANIEAATPELQKSAALDAVETARTELKGHIDTRTSFGQALASNLVAWVLTLFIGTMLLFLSRGPAPEEALNQIADKIAPAEVQPAKTPSAPAKP